MPFCSGKVPGTGMDGAANNPDAGDWRTLKELRLQKRLRRRGIGDAIPPSEDPCAWTCPSVHSQHRPRCLMTSEPGGRSSGPRFLLFRCRALSNDLPASHRNSYFHCTCSLRSSGMCFRSIRRLYKGEVSRLVHLELAGLFRGGGSAEQGEVSGRSVK